MNSKEIRERLIHYRAITERSSIKTSSRMAVGEMLIEIAAQLADSQVSLRDRFAMTALQGELASQDEYTGIVKEEDDGFIMQARRVYKIADAMLTAREEKSDGHT